MLPRPKKYLQFEYPIKMQRQQLTPNPYETYPTLVTESIDEQQQHLVNINVQRNHQYSMPDSSVLEWQQNQRID